VDHVALCHQAETIRAIGEASRKKLAEILRAEGASLPIVKLRNGATTKAL
jgi:hypothetical protein